MGEKRGASNLSKPGFFPILCEARGGKRADSRQKKCLGERKKDGEGLWRDWQKGEKKRVKKGGETFVDESQTLERPLKKRGKARRKNQGKYSYISLEVVEDP